MATPCSQGGLIMILILNDHLESMSASFSALFPIFLMFFGDHLKFPARRGASSWFSALLIQELGFALYKGAFRDALYLR